MIISNIHNRTPKSGILFTDICMHRIFLQRTQFYEAFQELNAMISQELNAMIYQELNIDLKLCF